MKRFILFLFLTAAFVPYQESIAQQPDTASFPYWIEMMQDPAVNFYDVQRAFNTYWADRKITRGSGWKPFKRWEYMVQNRILPDGTRPDQDQVWKEYYAYVQKHPDRQSLGQWVNLGPFTVPLARGYQGLGRINAIAFDPVDPEVIYIGAPSGGLWRSLDNGETWVCLTDELPTLGVSSIVIDFNDPDIIYIGTGDRDAGDAAGLGVMKSTDGGITWTSASNGMDNKTVGKLIMYPGDPGTILAATGGGVYKTMNGGESWYRTHAGDHKDIVFRVDDPNVVFATANGRLYVSFDLGESWSQVTNGITPGNRGAIGVTPADPNVVYFFTTTSSSYKGIFRSTDGGNSFTLMSTTPNIMSWGCNDSAEGGQAWYDLDIAVDEQDPNSVYAGGVNCFKSTDGGATWFIVSHWWGDCGVPAVHADLHVLEYNPHDGRLFAGNDGGIYYTADDGESWIEISNGLAISQTYRLGQSATSRNLVINGYQDNGTSTYTGQAWLNVYGGDGMECAFDYQDSRYSYATLYYGSIFRLFNNGNANQIAGEGVNGITEGGAWVTPFILSESDPAAMFVGYTNVWYCDNVKAGTIQWKKISEGQSAQVNVLEQSPADPGILYVARGNTLVSTNDAFGDPVEWISLNNFLPNSSSISDIEAHPLDPDVVYMTQGNHAYQSSDKGLSWIDITGSLPNIYFSGITYYKNSQDGLYLGTDAGIYYRDQSMDDWIQYSGGFPVAGRVTEIDIFYDPVSPEGDMLKAATYGRGLWESPPYHGVPSADFTADQTMIPAGCEVNFTDKSIGVPTSWQWTFEGASNPVSTEKNPSGIIYENEGVYPVKLMISNSMGSDSLIKTDYITVSEAITPQADFTAPVRSFCSGNAVATFNDLSLYCPVAWEWSFEPASVAFQEGTSSSSRNPVVS
ncbi:MAG: PKD domain-containing protein, partial [Bacteroidales bacterium]|nr:PKD domain-containing protein [Bacteroidales bacterium]